MPIRILTEQRVVTAYLGGEIDHHTAQQMRVEIDAAIATAEPELLVLDFSDVSFMDSSGIGLVMGRYRQIQPGGTLQLAGLSQQLYKVMRLAGLDRLAVLDKPGEVKR